MVGTTKIFDVEPEKIRLIYEIMNLRFDNYHTVAGGKAMTKYHKLTCDQLISELKKRRKVLNER